MTKNNTSRETLYKRVPPEHILPTILFIIIEGVLAPAAFSSSPWAQGAAIISMAVIASFFIHRFFPAFRTEELDFLSENGYKSLLTIHSFSTLFHLQLIIDEAISGDINLDNDDLFNRVRTKILESREHLLPFETEKIKNIPEELKKDLPDEEIRNFIENKIKRILQNSNIEENKKRKELFRAIQAYQADMKSRVVQGGKLKKREWKID